MKRRVAPFAFALLFGASLAQAQPSDDAATKDARARFTEGVELFDKGQYEAAKAKFVQAYALRKHPAVLQNLAQSSLKAGHPLEASKYFQQYLREATQATPQQRQDAEAGLAEARSKLGRIEIVAPAGTEIFIDADRVGVTPLSDATIDVEPGPRTVKGTKDGVHDQLKLTTVAGQKSQAKLFDKTTPTPAPVPAVVPTPAPAATASEPPPASPSPPPPQPPVAVRTSALSPPENMIPVFAGLGVGAAGFGTAIIFGILKSNAQSQADDVEKQIRTTAVARGLNPQGICNASTPEAQPFKNACGTYRDNLDTVDADALVANIGLGVGIAGVVFAGGWYLLAPKKAAKAEARTWTIVPELGAQRSGATLQGTF
jgi:tetratricopeptide (TPR) repeat protein